MGMWDKVLGKPGVVDTVKYQAAYKDHVRDAQENGDKPMTMAEFVKQEADKEAAKK